MIDPNIIASIAAFFTATGYLPQAIKTIKTRDTKAISFWMYLLSIIGVIFWLIFGLMVGNYPIIAKNIMILIFGGIILFIKTSHIIKYGEDIKSSSLLKFFKRSKNKS